MAFLIMPIRQQTWAEPAAYLESFALVPTYALIEYSVNVIGAVLALCAVLAIPHALRPVHEGWLRWATVIGLLGYSVISVQYLREIALIPPMAERYMMADAATRAIIAPNLYLILLDPHGWISYVPSELGSLPSISMSLAPMALAFTSWHWQVLPTGLW
jgi:hypothetical protein